LKGTCSHHGLLALVHLPASKVHGKRAAVGVVALVGLEPGLDSSKVAGCVPVATVQDPALIVEHDRLQLAALLDVSSEFPQLVLGEHGEQIQVTRR
jgi:hypothetical protein